MTKKNEYKGRVWTVPPCELPTSLLRQQEATLRQMVKQMGIDRQRGSEGDPHEAARYTQLFNTLMEMKARGFLRPSVMVPEEIMSRSSDGKIIPASNQRQLEDHDGIIRRDRLELIRICGGRFRGRRTDEPNEWALLMFNLSMAEGVNT